MNIRTRHLGILVYGGLVALIVIKGIVEDPVHIIGLVAPIVVLASADKVEAIVRGTSGNNADKA
jgi:hypothetical protein